MNWKFWKPSRGEGHLISPCPIHTLKIVNASDILEKLPEANPAHEFFRDVVDTYLDWSQTGTLQKLAGVDVILVKAEVILDKIDYRVKTEKGKEKKGTFVMDTIDPYLQGVDYVNVYMKR
jgi:hypothetical protein